MFKTDGTKFHEAYEEVKLAEQYLNQCKAKLLTLELYLKDDFNFYCLKNNINNCNINLLINKIETIKKDLLNMNSDFSESYFKSFTNSINSLSSVDSSSLNESEQMLYTINSDEAMSLLLYTLESYEKQGLLDEAGKEFLAYQKVLVEQKEIHEKLVVTDSSTKEYVSLCEQYLECERKLIELDSSLDFGEKCEKLKEFDEQKEINLKVMSHAYNDELRREELEKELKELYKQRKENNGIFHPKIEKKLEEQIEEIEKELGLEHKAEGIEKFFQGVGTFALSNVQGFLDLGEGVLDAHVYVAGLVSSLWIGDNDWAEDLISRDFVGDTYDWATDKLGINEEMAHGKLATVGNMVGERGGYYALSSVPFVGQALCTIAGAGSAVEENINYQLSNTGTVNEGTAFFYSFLGSVEGYSSGKSASSLRKGIAEVGKLGLGNTAKSALTVLKNSGGLLAAEAAKKTFCNPALYIESGAVILKDIFSAIYTGDLDWFQILLDLTLTVLEEHTGDVLSVFSPTIMKQAELEKVFNSPEADDYFARHSTVESIENDVNKIGLSENNVSGTDNLVSTRSYKDTEHYSSSQIKSAVDDFEARYSGYGYTVDDIKTDSDFREMLLGNYVVNPESEIAVIGKTKPNGNDFGYEELANDPNFCLTLTDGSSMNATHLDYRDDYPVLEGVLGSDNTYDTFNHSYIDEIIQEARTGRKRIILTSGPDSIDWGTGMYGRELTDISSALGIDDYNDLAKYLKKLDVEVGGRKGFVYEIDFSLL